jgi:hypothetical protein
LAKPSGHTIQDGRAAVGSHHEQALLAGEALQLDLLLDRHVVAEEEDVEAALERLERLRRRVGAPASR